MARTFSAGQRSAISADHVAHSLRLEVEDPDGTYRNLSSYFASGDYLVSFQLQEGIDANAMQMRAVLVRDNGSTASLAPLREDSVLNVDSGASYAPFLDVGRKWRASVSVVAYGSAESYEYIGEGLIDSVEVNDPEPTITLYGRCLGASLLDRWIDTEREYGGSHTASGVWSVSGVAVFGGGAASVGDGDVSANAWSTDSASAGDSVQVDMGDAIEFDTVRIYAATSGYAGTYKVRGSNDEDASSWTDLTGGGGFTPSADGWNVKTFTAASYRHWRLELTNTPGPSVALNEAQFFSSDHSMENVIQDMLDDNLTSAPTLSVPVSPDFQMSRWTQQKESLMVAINKVAQLAGMVVRYRYDSSDNFALTLYAPDRTAEPGDEEWELGPEEYTDLPVASLDIEGVRNRVILRYSTGSAEASHTENDAASIIRYGGPHAIPRVLEIDFSPNANIYTADRANTLAEAILSDLSEPAFVQRVRVPGFWIAQLGDYGKFLANDVHYDVDQYGGVTHISHVFADGHYDVTLGIRGQPSARYRGWIRDTAASPGKPLGMLCRAEVQTTNATTVVVRVHAADPLVASDQRRGRIFGGGHGIVSVEASAAGCTLVTTSPQLLGSLGVTADLGTTAYADFTITRPSFQTGTGRVAFTATRTGRAAGTDSVDIPAQERDTQPAQVKIERVSETADELVVRVKAITPNAGATCTVSYDAGGLTVSPASGGTFTSTTSFGTTNYIDYTITRAAIGGTPRRVAFTVGATGFVDGTDGVDVPPNSSRFRCKLTNSSGQTAPDGGSLTLAFDTETFDVGTLHDTATNNSRITVPTNGNTGVWLFTAVVAIQTTTGGGYRAVEIVKNGATIIGAMIVGSAGSVEDTVITCVGHDNAPSVGDYYQVFVGQDSGGDLAVRNTTTHFAATHLW